MRGRIQGSAPYAFFFTCAVFWAFLWIVVFSPDFGSSDVYLFRDAATNYLMGKGFTTFALERQTSFQSVLYSSYTPGIQWLYIPFAWVCSISPRAANAFNLICAYSLDAIFLFIGWSFSEKGWFRYVFCGCLALFFPVAGLAIDRDRPEYVSLVVLSAVLFLLSRPRSWKGSVLLGLLAFIAFLMEPIAGGYAVFLIVGAWIVESLHKGTARRSSDRSASKTLLAIGLFAGGICCLSGLYLRSDPQSLHRFVIQARDGGFQRHLSSRTGDFFWPPSRQAIPPQIVPSHSTKLLEIYEAFVPKSKTEFVQSMGLVACILLFFGFVIRAQVSFLDRVTLLLLGLTCLIMPLVFFPLQGNYRTFSVPLLVIALAFNWGGTRRSLAADSLLPILLVVFFVGDAPGVIPGYLIRMENRASYQSAVRQANALGEYLAQHPGLRNGVFLVPNSHYFLYKNIVENMTTAGYVTSKENPLQVRGVVNCYAGTDFFAPVLLPLSDFLKGQSGFQRIESKRTDVRYFVPLMPEVKNETWECDIYIRR